MSLEADGIYTLLGNVAATGASTKIADVTGFSTGPAIHVIISGVAGVQIQASLDRVNWVTTNSLSVSDIYVLDVRGCYYRANVSSYASGVVSVFVGPGLTAMGQVCVTAGPQNRTGGPV